MDDDALPVLKAHDWPGNVRELRNVIERAVLSCRQKTIRLSDLPESLRAIGQAAPPGMIVNPLDLGAQERRLIVEALEKSGGNQTKAAGLLNITRNTIRYRMRKYNLPGS